MEARRPRVVLSAQLPSEARAIVGGFDVVEPPAGDAALGPERLAAALVEADAVVALLSDRIDASLLARAPRLRIVANFAVGVNNVDVAEATRRGIAVTNTPDVLTDATADLAMGLLIAAARRFGEGEALVRGGAWRGWEPLQLPGADLAGATLGIVGLGRIGRAVARRAAAFGLRILYASPRRAPAEVERALGAEHVALDELLERAHFVSLHCLLSDETRHLIGVRELARMRPGAVLVNTARGPLVDEPALASAVLSGRLRCALDVYEDEPRVHPDLLRAPGAVLLPHLGSATAWTRRRMAELAAESVVDVLAGRRPRNLVNPEALSRG